MEVVLGWLAGAIVVGRMLPQVARVYRSGSFSGVSRLGVIFWFGNDMGWLFYGLGAGLTPVWVSSVVLLLLDVSLLWLMGGGSAFSRMDLVGALWPAVALGAHAAQGPFLAVFLVVSSVVGTVPHALAALRSSDVSGISPSSWRVALLDGVTWLTYGVVARDVPVAAYGFLTLVSAWVILWRVSRSLAPYRAILSSGGADAFDADREGASGAG